MSEAYYDKRKNDGEVRVLIEEIRGEVKLLSAKIDELVKSVDLLTRTTVTREELKLTLDIYDNRITTNGNRISNLEKFRDSIYYLAGAIALGVIVYTISRAIPGFSL